MGQAGFRQRFEVLHPVRFRHREGHEFAAQFFWHGLIFDAEIPHVQFVNYAVFRVLQRRFSQRIPASRLQPGVRQLDHLALETVG